MFTVCPKCALTLVVTAADLRVAQGYVRCGRCSSVFNALAQLSDERHASGTGSSPAAAAPPAPAPHSPAAPTGPPAGRQPPARAPLEAAPPPAGNEDAVSEDALEFDASRTDVNSVFVEPAPDPQWTAATGSFKAMRASGQDVPAAADTAPAAARARPGGPASPPAEAPVDVEIDSALLADIVQGEHPGTGSPGTSRGLAAAPAARTGPASRAGTSVAETASRAARTRVATDSTATVGGPDGRAAEETEAAEAAAEAMLPAPHPLAHVLARLSARESAPWAIGAAALLVLLGAQIVNHLRDALATHARFNRPLTALYAAFGVSLRPQWDLRAYDVRQLGASVDPGSGGEITVRASIRNGGLQPQPLPLLRVTLEDRFGTPLASRDVSPRDYLPGAVPASSFLSVDQRIDAEMAFVDPGSSAVGFEIDACLPAAAGAVACAHDPASR
jgi:predicted Zn finger-like uncharacterized protein